MGIKIWWEEPGMRELMQGKAIQGIEEEIMNERLANIEAEFFQKFGFHGSFAIEKVDTKSKRPRTAFRIVATNARTTTALQREPGWLAQFLN